MTKMEVEFNDEQLERVKLLESHDISVGDAIDMLFEARDKASSIIDDIDKNLAKNKAIDAQAGDSEESQHDKKTYDEAIQDYKHHVSWAKDFFRI